MITSPCLPFASRVLRRLAVVAAAATLAVAVTPLLAGASPVADTAPTIGTITATGGDVTVTWVNGAPDATSIDVILYDQNGNVIEDDSVGPTTTTDTFDNVADGGGYTIDVIATTPGGALDPGASSAFDIYQGAYLVDTAPTIGTITATGGDVTVTWVNGAPDATSIDVILYDQNGNVIEDDSVGPTTTTDTFDNVADGGGYTIDVIATTPGGALDPGASSAFDIYQGAYLVDTAPTIGTITATGGDVTVTWVNGAPDATSIDVILYDQNGNVIEDDSVGPTTTTDTFDNVADGGGYTIDVIATTPGGALDPGASSAFDIYQGAYLVDTAPTIGTITATGGDVTVTWVNGAPDATSIDVILYDQNGNVIEDDSVGPTTTTDTFDNVADGQGYTIDVIATTPGGALDPGSSAPFDLIKGSLSLDVPVTITSITATGGVITITWSSGAMDVVGYDVILLNGTGATVEDDAVGASALTDSFASVADGNGFRVEVVEHTAVGDFSTTSWTFDLADGSIAPVPVVDPSPTPAPIVVPAASVTVTPIDGGLGGWLVSWPELSSAPTDGQYVVTDDQGDTCTASPTGVAGTSLSCTLPARADGSTGLTGVTVTFEFTSVLWFGATSGGYPKDAASPGVAPTAVATASSSPTPTVVRHAPTTPDAVVAPIVPGRDATPFVLLGAGLLALAMALAAVALRRRHRAA